MAQLTTEPCTSQISLRHPKDSRYYRTFGDHRRFLEVVRLVLAHPPGSDPLASRPYRTIVLNGTSCVIWNARHATGLDPKATATAPEPIGFSPPSKMVHPYLLVAYFSYHRCCLRSVLGSSSKRNTTRSSLHRQDRTTLLFSCLQNGLVRAAKDHMASN